MSDQGIDINEVGVALTGMAAIAPAGTTLLDDAALAAEEVTLDPAFRKVGLRTEDGAPEWTEEADGDPIQFYEDGYSIPTGRANVTVAMTLAQTSRLVYELKSGNEFDANGVIKVNAGSNLKDYVLYTEDVFANGMIERRQAPRVTVQSVTTNRNTRGEVTGHEVTFQVHRVAGRHYDYAQIRPEGGVEAQGFGAQSVPDDSWTVADLRDHAARVGVEVPSSATKADLLAALS